jgi:hypothetical protein
MAALGIGCLVLSCANNVPPKDSHSQVEAPRSTQLSADQLREDRAVAERAKRDFAMLIEERSHSVDRQVRASEHRANLAGLTNELIDIANDRMRSAEERRAAILELGKIRTVRAVDYLIWNIGLSIPHARGNTEEERLLRTPCYYALLTSWSESSASDWNIAARILWALEMERTDKELIMYSSVLRSVLSQPRAREYVRAEVSLEKARPVPDQPRLKHLERILAILES